MTIVEILNQLSNTSSRNAKLEILKRNKNNLDLKECFRLAYNPYINFYIRKVPKYTSNPKVNILLTHALKGLSTLYQRHKTGNAALEYLSKILSEVTPDNAEVVGRVVQKDLHCGVSVATINAVWPELVPIYPIMLCSGYDQKLIDKMEFPAIFQMKMDGMRFNAVVKHNTVQYFSRNGKSLDLKGSLDTYFEQMANDEELVFDGELLVIDKNGNPLPRQIGNGILSKTIKETVSEKECEQIGATLWDVIPFKVFQTGGPYNVSYDERYTDLQKRWASIKTKRIQLVETVFVTSLNQVVTIFNDYLKAGKEGGVLKALDGFWENKRSKSQIKFKNELECDLRCIRVEEGTGKNKGKIGALVLQSFDLPAQAVEVKVGSGLSDDDRACPKSLYIGQIVTVKYNCRIKDQKTGNDSLFLPVFVKVRLDKETADSSPDIR